MRAPKDAGHARPAPSRLPLAALVAAACWRLARPRRWPPRPTPSHPYDDAAYWAFADRMQQRARHPLGRAARLLPARRRRRRADGQLDAAAHLQRRRDAGPRGPGPQRPPRPAARQAARRARRRSSTTAPRPAGQVPRARLGELDDAAPAASTSSSTPRSSTVSSTPTAPASELSLPAVDRRRRSATRSTAPPAASSGATRRSG